MNTVLLWAGSLPAQLEQKNPFNDPNSPFNDPNSPFNDAEFATAGGLAMFPFMFMLMVILGVLLVQIAIFVGICLLTQNLVKVIPSQFRQIEPGLVWLLLIPLFNIIWTFFVFPKVSRSYQYYLNATAGGTGVHGDCNEQLGLWYCICVCCTLIPCVNYIAAPASLVLLIIWMVKMYDLKRQVMPAK